MSKNPDKRWERCLYCDASIKGDDAHDAQLHDPYCPHGKSLVKLTAALADARAENERVRLANIESSMWVYSMMRLTDAGAWCEFLKHGEQDHQDWMREAIQAFINDNPRPEPRGLGRHGALIAQHEATIRALESHQRWVAVSERKPDSDRYVLTLSEVYDGPEVGWWQAGIDSWSDIHGRTLPKLTHWREIGDLPARSEGA